MYFFAAGRPAVAGRRATGEAVRFDVIAVRFPADGRGRPDVRHYPGAFESVSTAAVVLSAHFQRAARPGRRETGYFPSGFHGTLA